MERLKEQLESISSGNVIEKSSQLNSLITEFSDETKEDVLIYFCDFAGKESPHIAAPLFEKFRTTILPLIANVGKRVRVAENILKNLSQNISPTLHPILFGIRILVAEGYQIQGKKSEAYNLLKDNILIVNNRDANDLIKHYVKIAFLALTSSSFLSLKSYENADLQDNESYRIAAEAYQRSYTCRENLSSLDTEYSFENKYVDACLSEASKQFQKAAEKYYNLAKGKSEIFQNPTYKKDFTQALLLSRSISNILIAPTSSLKERFILLLSNEKMIEKWDVLKIIKKIRNRRFITPSDVKNIIKDEPKPGAPIPTNSFFFPSVLITYLPHGILEENILRVSELYNNITISHLAKILNVEEGNVLEVVLPLFVSGAISGKVSLIDNIINFKTDTQAVEEWTGRIGKALNRISEVANKIGDIKQKPTHK